MDNIKYWIWYGMAMGNKKALAKKLYQHIGDIETIYNCTYDDFENVGLKKEQHILPLCNKDLSKANRELWFADKYNVKIISMEDECYPYSLKHISDPPMVLYIRGKHFNPNDELYISIVGARDCTGYGAEFAKKIAFDLASNGITVVSGMAYGTDSAAHRGALAAGGKTLAIFGCGVNRVYPKSNAELMVSIMNNGCVISEFDFEEQPHGHNFPMRNRIISGVSLGVLVVEAKVSSGSLITADLALEQGKDAFAAPGGINDANFAGCNKLIKQGAKLVTCARDIIEEYEDVYGDIMKRNSPVMNSLEFDIPLENDSLNMAIMKALEERHMHIEELCSVCNINMPSASGVLTLLELEGKIIQMPGKMFGLNNYPM